MNIYNPLNDALLAASELRSMSEPEFSERVTAESVQEIQETTEHLQKRVDAIEIGLQQTRMESSIEAKYQHRYNGIMLAISVVSLCLSIFSLLLAIFR